MGVFTGLFTSWTLSIPSVIFCVVIMLTSHVHFMMSSCGPLHDIWIPAAHVKMEVPVLIRSLKSSILSSTSSQLDDTFWGVGSAAVEQSGHTADMVDQSDIDRQGDIVIKHSLQGGRHLKEPLNHHFLGLNIMGLMFHLPSKFLSCLNMFFPTEEEAFGSHLYVSLPLPLKVNSQNTPALCLLLLQIEIHRQLMKPPGISSLKLKCRPPNKCLISVPWTHFE